MQLWWGMSSLPGTRGEARIFSRVGSRSAQKKRRRAIDQAKLKKIVFFNVNFFFSRAHPGHGPGGPPPSAPARDVTFQNTARASKHQAVALRVGSDLSAFYRCSFVGYQDTLYVHSLYVHSLRQFYRECDIYGIVDFIFGNTTVVFQRCNLYARRPDVGEKYTYTAQGREDPNQNTDISIQNCKLLAASNLAAVKSSFKTYLGRPWKQYSRTVVMQSEIDDVVNAAGWLEWSDNFALNTLFYGEYLNRGTGAGTLNRVLSTSAASHFTVQNFISGAGVSLPLAFHSRPACDRCFLFFAPFHVFRRNILKKTVHHLATLKTVEFTLFSIRIKVDVVVAKDGSGKYTTVSAAPSNSRYIIYIKADTYKRLITGDRNVKDGWTTFRSTTVGKLSLSL
ncbi:Pectinesterase [Nymphaea thermarum]|nr:Pectinesterase [Nymphaea thermarum]